MRVLHISSGNLYGGVETLLVTLARCRHLCPARLGLTDKIGFTGFLDDTSSAMRSLDLIVHASTQPEPFGMVIAEGLACGKPVVATRDSGATELFCNGKDIQTYTGGEAEALADCILRSIEQSAAQTERKGNTQPSTEALLDNLRLASDLDTAYQQIRQAA